MAGKQRKIEEFITLTAEAKKTVSYVDYFARRPLFYSLQIKNDGAVDIEGLTLSVHSENGLTVDTVKTIEKLPFESAVEAEIGCILSPVYFAQLETAAENEIFITLKKDKKLIAELSVRVLALPFDDWEGLSGDLEGLASFVRPKLADCSRLAKEADEQLKKWSAVGELGGYEGNDKNFVRRAIAAVFARLRSYAFERVECDWTVSVCVGAGTRLLHEKRATEIEAALFAASVLERMGFHPVLALGEKDLGVGVWLYESCFLDTVSDDTERIAQYISDGINNLSFFAVEDIFDGKNASFTTSEAHFADKLSAGRYEKFVDIRRLRIARVLPLPLKQQGAKGIEILSEQDSAFDAAPEDFAKRKNLQLDSKQTKNKQWERRLLDLSLKNALLNFSPEKNAVQIVSASADATLAALEAQGELTLAPATGAILSAKNRLRFGATRECQPQRELIELENTTGTLRTYLDSEELAEIAGRLQKRGKEADEESGTKILYLAIGFLKWQEKEGKEKYAPHFVAACFDQKTQGNGELFRCDR